MRRFLLFLSMTVCACAPLVPEGPPPEPRALAAASAAEPRSVPLPTYLAPQDCGRAYLARVAAAASGRAERHPAIVALDAKLATCPKPFVASPEGCIEVAAERAGAGAVYGPAHPAWRALDAEAEACKDVPPPAPSQPVAVACEELKRRREVLVQQGKGERHPQILLVDRQLTRCVNIRN